MSEPSRYFDREIEWGEDPSFDGSSSLIEKTMGEIDRIEGTSSKVVATGSLLTAVEAKLKEVVGQAVQEARAEHEKNK